MFVDASAIVAVLTGEPDADALADTLDTARAPITSAVAVFEATRGYAASGTRAWQRRRPMLRSS